MPYREIQDDPSDDFGRQVMLTYNASWHTDVPGPYSRERMVAYNTGPR